MFTFTTPQKLTAAGCIAVGLVPYLAHASGYMWWAALASVLAGSLLGPRGVLLVAGVCFALLVAAYLEIQARGLENVYGTGGDGIRASTAHALLTEAMFVGASAAFGVMTRWLIETGGWQGSGSG